MRGYLRSCNQQFAMMVFSDFLTKRVHIHIKFHVKRIFHESLFSAKNSQNKKIHVIGLYKLVRINPFKLLLGTTWCQNLIISHLVSYRGKQLHRIAGNSKGYSQVPHNGYHTQLWAYILLKWQYLALVTEFNLLIVFKTVSTIWIHWGSILSLVTPGWIFDTQQ